jgi:hypothetical protein
VTATIDELLQQAAGDRRPGATEEQIDALEKQLGVRLPDDHRAFLSWSDGWDGEFGDTWLVLDNTEALADGNDESFRKSFPGYVAVGGNGGLETFALDYRKGTGASGVVAIDRNSASPDDIWRIASSLTGALERLLDQPDGPWGPVED